jgi:hypothetical protein
MVCKLSSSWAMAKEIDGWAIKHTFAAALKLRCW